MLVLTFTVGKNRYGIEGSRIVEIVPLVQLWKLPHAAAYVAGVFHYRGRMVPVIDLHCLLGGIPCRQRLSTRIVVAEYDANGEVKLLGLLVEQATETIDVGEKEILEPGVTVKDAPYLGGIVRNTETLVQCIDLPKILPEVLKQSLFATSETDKA